MKDHRNSASELDGTKSKKSLAEIYEDEWQEKVGGKDKKPEEETNPKYVELARFDFGFAIFSQGLVYSSSFVRDSMQCPISHLFLEEKKMKSTFLLSKKVNLYLIMQLTNHCRRFGYHNGRNYSNHRFRCNTSWS